MQSDVNWIFVVVCTRRTFFVRVTTCSASNFSFQPSLRPRLSDNNRYLWRLRYFPQIKIKTDFTFERVHYEMKQKLYKASISSSQRITRPLSDTTYFILSLPLLLCTSLLPVCAAYAIHCAADVL